MKKKAFDLLTLGEILLRLSPPDNERIVRGETFQKQVGGAELNVASGVSLPVSYTHLDPCSFSFCDWIGWNTSGRNYLGNV